MRTALPNATYTVCYLSGVYPHSVWQSSRKDADVTYELIALHFKDNRSQRAKQPWDIYICINRDYDKEARHIITLCWAIVYVLWWVVSVYLWVYTRTYLFKFFFLWAGYHTRE